MHQFAWPDKNNPLWKYFLGADTLSPHLIVALMYMYMAMSPHVLVALISIPSVFHECFLKG